MTNQSIDARTMLRSTGAVREFRPDPVPDELLHGILETARFAPNGGNRQAWRVVVVQDADTRARLRDAYLPGWYEYLAMMEAGLTPFAALTDVEAEARARARAPEIAARAAEEPGFAEHFDQVPALLVVLADLQSLATVDRDLGRYTLVGGASIYPFVWSILLAAHTVGLGGVITTMAVLREPEVKALLGVPDHLCVAAVVALGYPVHRPTQLTRNAVDTFTTVDAFDGPPLAHS